jgi:putative zinc finger/helix-turn-helix YgiT family protein
MKNDDQIYVELPVAVVHPECPDCDGLEVRTKLLDQTFQYGRGTGEVAISVVVPVRQCLDCGAEWTDAEAEELRWEGVCKHFKRLAPRRLLAIRESLGLSQVDFGRLTGFGVASLSRWETGVQMQSVSCDRLLRLLEADPQNVVRLKQVANAELPKASQFQVLEITPDLRLRQRAFRLPGHENRRTA